jgi:hypothetical protein
MRISARDLFFTGEPQMSLSYVKHRQAIEKKIVSIIVTDALAQGYTVAIDNGGDEPTDKMSDFKTIMAETMHTDEEALRFFDRNGVYIGSVFLVYGNDGFDAIADYSARDEIVKILGRAEAFAMTAEAEERV